MAGNVGNAAADVGERNMGVAGPGACKRTPDSIEEGKGRGKGGYCERITCCARTDAKLAEECCEAGDGGQAAAGTRAIWTASCAVTA